MVADILHSGTLLPHEEDSLNDFYLSAPDTGKRPPTRTERRKTEMKVEMKE